MASNHPVTPRQKMINMMYLVLTALLALNVSKEVLNAFAIINESLVKANEVLDNKNNVTWQQFVGAYNNDKAKVQKYYDKAKEMQAKGEALINYIRELRTDVITYTEKSTKDRNSEDWKNFRPDTFSVKDIGMKDNYDKPMEILIGQSETGTGAKGEELKNKINEFKEYILKIDPKYKFPINTGDGFNKDVDRVMPWQYNTFYHTILAADVALFNKFTADIKNTEADMLTFLMSSIHAKDFTFDKVGAKVIPKSRFVVSGDKYEADIIVAAYSSTQAPYAIINGNNVAGDSGKVRYAVPAGAEGVQKYSGTINIKDPSGKIVSYPFESEYVVARPSATVAAEKMNVFYIGLDNPVSVSVPGMSDDKVFVSMSNGQIRKVGKGKYMVRVGGKGEARVNVTADLGGAKKSMGAFTYRIKKIPDPIPMIAGSKGGPVNKNAIAAAPYLNAVLEDFLFDGVRYTVIGFEFSTLGQGGLLFTRNLSGSQLTPECIEKCKTGRSGQKVFFDNIQARGPDGTTRRLPALILKLM
ncbi:MAG: gliding motility protein GldM [Bacteroidales bacterium]|nr:gliding motility protein GldM [Bacteroidales bacterium]